MCLCNNTYTAHRRVCLGIAFLMVAAEIQYAHWFIPGALRIQNYATANYSCHIRTPRFISQIRWVPSLLHKSSRAQETRRTLELMATARTQASHHIVCLAFSIIFRLSLGFLPLSPNLYQCYATAEAHSQCGTKLLHNMLHANLRASATACIFSTMKLTH